MAQQKGKKVVVRRRRERKNIENGCTHSVYIQQHHRNDHRYTGQCHFMGKLRRTGLPWFQKVDSVCSTDRSRDCS